MVDRRSPEKVVADNWPWWLSVGGLAGAAQRNPEKALEAGLSVAPVTGEAMSLRDAWNASGRAGDALSQGNFGDAATGYVDMATELLGAIPIAGTLARSTKRGAQWMDRNLPKGLNAFLDAPEDAGRTLYSGVGPSKSGRGSFDLDFYGQPVKILQNPSPQQMKGFINRSKYKAARRIVDGVTGDVYIWDAGDPALHKLVAEQLGIDPAKMTGDMIEVD